MQLLPVRLRNDRFEIAVLKEYLRRRSSAMFEREKVDLFIADAENDVHPSWLFQKMNQP